MTQSKSQIHTGVIEALGSAVASTSDPEEAPLELDCRPPLLPRLRVYVFRVTRQHGGRPQDEYKIQVILPGQARGSRATLDTSGSRVPVIMGYSSDFDVFVMWDALAYVDFSYSRNMQVKEETMLTALEQRVASQDRVLRQGGRSVDETIVACHRAALIEGLSLRLRVTAGL